MSAAPITVEQADALRRLAQEWTDRADSHVESSVPCVELRNCVADLHGLLDVLTERPALEKEITAVLSAWQNREGRSGEPEWWDEMSAALEALDTARCFATGLLTYRDHSAARLVLEEWESLQPLERALFMPLAEAMAKLQIEVFA